MILSDASDKVAVVTVPFVSDAVRSAIDIVGAVSSSVMVIVAEDVPRDAFDAGK